MATTQDLKIRYTGDVSGVKKATSDIDKMHTGLSSKLSAVGKKMTSVGKTATLGLTLPLVAFGVSAVKAFGEAEQGIAQTNAVLKSTHQAAGVTASDIDKLSTRIGKMSVQDDDAIRAGENLLLTFTNIRNEVGGEFVGTFNRATYAMTDIAAAMGTAPKDAAIQLGKALNDPVKGISALSRIGVTFTEEQKKQVEHMVKTNDTAGAQALILDELNKEFGGSAKAMGKSATPSERLSVAFGELSETVGKYLTPVLASVTQFLERAFGAFQHLSPGVQKIIVIIGIAVAAIGPLLIILGSLAGALASVGGLFATGGLLASMAFMPWVAIAAAVVALVIIIVKNWGTIKTFLLNVWHTLQSVWEAVWKRIRGVVIPIFKAIVTYIKIQIAIASAVFKVFYTIVRIVFAAIWAVAKVVWGAITAYIRASVAFWKPIITTAKAFIVGVWHAIHSVAVTVWNAIGGTVKGIWNGIISVVKGAANVVIGLINGIIHGINTVINASNHLPGPDISTIPDIPQLRRGGVIAASGMALVGERGPELVSLPRGARVHPNGADVGGGITINVAGSILTERDLADVVQRALLRKRQRNGVLGLS